MKNRISKTILAALLLSAIFTLQLPSLFAQGTAFTYQGRLLDNGNPANGGYDLTFALLSASTGPDQIGGTLTNNATAVSNGLFTVTLDFGASFPGADRWLEISVRTNGGGAFSTLTPRQPITAAPYAITAGNLTGTVSATGLSGTYSSAMTFNNAANSFTGNGSGLTDVNAATLGGLSSSNFWKTTGNAGTTAETHFLGTTDNQAVELKVNGTRALRLEPTANDSVNVVGGSAVNFVAPGVHGATITGGGVINYTNKVLADFGTVGGGRGNTSSVKYATVGGGALNTSSGEAATVAGGSVNTSSAEEATVGGGGNNTSSGVHATVGGGLLNTSSGYAATVGGGTQNTSSGSYATVPGGYQNSAAGDYSFAAGRSAKANHTGAFVWADYSTAADFASTAVNQFLIRAANGVGIGTSNPQYPLDVVGWVRFSNVGDGAEILNLSIERSWAFRQLGSGAATALELASIGGGGNKNFVINTTGFVGIGTTAPGFNLHVNGTAGKPGGGSWSAASDARLKKNIRPLAGALDKLLALHGVTFEYIDPAKIHELSGERMGLVAQEVEKVFPDWVETGADGYKRVTVRGLEALVVEALRESQQKQDAGNENLAAELKRLDAENTELKARLEKLEQILNGTNGGAK